MGMMADVVVVSDGESDDISFLAAGPSKRAGTRLPSTKIPISIDSSDDEDEGPVSLADLVAASRARAGLSTTTLVPPVASDKGKERGPAMRSYQDYSRPLGSILNILDADGARPPPLAGVPPSAGAIPKQHSTGRVVTAEAGNRKKRKSQGADDDASQEVLPARLSREERDALRAKEKAEKQLARATAKAAKEAERSYQKKLAQVNKLRTSKNDVVRELVLYLSHDLSFPTSPIAGALPELTARLADHLSALQFLAADDSPVPGVIKFKRHVQASWDSKARRYIPLAQPVWHWEPVIMIVATADDIVDKVANDPTMLSAWVRDIRLILGLDHNDQVIMLVRGLSKYHAKTKALENREFTAAARAGIDGAGTARSVDVPGLTVRPSKSVIERCMVELQITENVHIIHVEKTGDVEEWLWNLSADIALRPYKVLAKSHLNFAPLDKPRKAASPTDALEMMLQEVQGITPSAASGIAAQHPTFADLMKSFERVEHKGGVERAEGLLADCEIRTLKNGSASGRILNKALAKRVYHVFRGEDSLALA